MDIVVNIVSVPIRGLFNLTRVHPTFNDVGSKTCFRPHQGII